MAAPADLTVALVQAHPAEDVHLVAAWLESGIDVAAGPPLTGDRKVDALVASTVAYRAHQAGGRRAPGWTCKHQRIQIPHWSPEGHTGALWRYCLDRTPDEFLWRGIVVDEGELRGSPQRVAQVTAGEGGHG